MAKLSIKQQRFVDAYTGNGTDAARKAGYKGNDNTLCSVGKENLRKPHILRAIRQREDQRKKNLIATREERQQFWTAVLRDEIGDEPQDIKDRLRAAELLGKSEGDFIDRKEITGANGGPIETKQQIIENLLAEVDGSTRGLPV